MHTPSHVFLEANLDKWLDLLILHGPEKGLTTGAQMLLKVLESI